MRGRGGVPIRVRLAAGTVAVAAIVLALLTLVIVVQVQHAATAAATELAADDLRPYAVDLRQQPDERPDLPSAGLLVLVVGPDGAARRDSMPAALARAARTVPHIGEVAVPGGRFQVVARTVRTAGGVWRLWAARDLTASDALLRGVLLAVLIGAPLAVLASGVAAWFVATRTLQPVDRMRMSADRLRTPGATGVLPVHGGSELADLATTLNGLIEDLRAGAARERRVTADAAHELRTPLAVLTAQVELAQRHPGPAALDAVRASVDRMARLADTVLALSRADAVEVERPRDAPVAALVTEAMSAVDQARVLAERGTLVDLELGAALDEADGAPIDVHSFGRILTNLVGNALAAGPRSEVVVRLSSDHGDLVVEVADDGPGVPPAFLPFAFDRFSRPETARNTASSGAGLGLALVQRLAERSGGSARLRNGEDHGAIATVRIPLRRGRPE